MPQIFHPSFNTISRVSVFGAVLILGGLFGLAAAIVRSPYVTETGVIRSQPVPFSHQHHVGEDGIDCRYCHRTATTSASAGMPTTEICMGCHSQVWADSEMLAVVRTSWQTDRPLTWVRVHDLPDFVYFHHGAHASSGIGCESCHGRVDKMPLTWRNATLRMDWCLDCHRDPERHRRPVEAVAEMGWKRGDEEESGEHPVVPAPLRGGTHCSTCHR